MADQVTVANSPLTDYVVSTDDAGSSGQVQRFKLAYSADGSAVHVPADVEGLYVQTIERAQSPQYTAVTATSVAAGGSSALNAADITTGKTGQLLGVDVGASVPYRCDIEIVNGPRTVVVTCYGIAGQTTPWRTPSRRLFTLAGGAGKHFGVTVFNLSPHLQADIRATVYWDEVT